MKRALWWTIAGLVVLTPLVMFPWAKDMFRLPKRSLFIAGSSIILAVILTGILTARFQIARDRLRSSPFVIAALIVGWTLLTSLFSTNRTLSVSAFTITCAYALFFFAASALMSERPLRAGAVVFIPAALNAVLVIAQENGLQPFELQDFWYDPHLASTGFMGNPNAVGTLLMGPTLAAMASTFVVRGAARIAAMALSALLLAGILASQTLTAVIALLAGAATLALIASWRRALPALAAIAALCLLLGAFYQPLRMRIDRLQDRLAQRDYNALLTNRLTPFAAAVELARQHPLTGAGPGTFGWNYFQTKVAVDRKYPSLMGPTQRLSWNYSFSEVHNDHLEIVSETGMVGYALFLAALVALARASFGRTGGVDDPRRRFAQIFSMPLAVSFTVLTLAQFPLQLPSIAVTYLFLAACCVGWWHPSASPLVLGAGGKSSPRTVIGTAVLIAVAASAAVYFLAVLPLRCEVQLRRLEETTSQAMSSHPRLAAPIARETIERVDDALEHCRDPLEFLMIKAANLRILNRLEEAAETYRVALTVEKRPEIYFQLGATLLASGESAAATDAFVQACRFQPSLLEQVPQPVLADVQSRISR